MDDWEKFITGSEVINLPKITNTTKLWFDLGLNGIGSLADHMGIPVQQMSTTGAATLSVSALPFRAYQKIWKDYYRDQNLDGDIDIDMGSIDRDCYTATALLTLRKRNLEKDYFTSALPTPQFGNPVSLPLGGTIPVTGVLNTNITGTSPNKREAAFMYDGKFGAQDNGTQATVTSGLSADLSLATATSVSDLRRAYALQRYQELLMRGGRRLKEWTLNIFGVNVPDERIQRTEYLGGGKLGLQISEVIQTVGDDESQNPLGGMAGHGVAGGNVTGFNRYFSEHGYIIGIMSILPRTGYFQGVPKNLLKFDKFDYYTPPFAHIGEQAIQNQELYLSNSNTTGWNTNTFGYTPRYAEYRDNHDTISGDFRVSLRHWHLAKQFNTAPGLNATFIKVDPDSFDRVFAVQGDEYDKFLVQTYLKITAFRPVSKFGNPI
ncbi:unnamed protein product [Rotaria socialis]|uniref:Major capsid protein n=1 Tax=Rotaria socialis TaxID=392032 RepID=A0A820Z1G0_9BILA|nr:unnamed protein product [Rotaria socialis]CAF4550965.1 unnamed protein product [Rotaria socialis]